MSNYTESFNINAEDVTNVSLSYEGYAKYLEETEIPEKDFLIGSSYLIAATFKSLLTPYKAKKLFHSAAAHFIKAKSQLALLCNICAQDTFGKELNDKELLFAYFNENNDLVDNILDDHTEGFLPKLNIPSRLLKGALTELEEYNFESEKFQFINLFRLIARLDELKYQHNKTDYRWQNVEGGMLPYEPEELAIIIILIKKWNRFSSFEEFKNILRNLDVENSALYEIADRIIDKNR